jgi:hypothetical protein
MLSSSLVVLLHLHANYRMATVCMRRATSAKQSSLALQLVQQQHIMPRPIRATPRRPEKEETNMLQ